MRKFGVLLKVILTNLHQMFMEQTPLQGTEFEIKTRKEHDAGRARPRAQEAAAGIPRRLGLQAQSK